MGIQDHQVFCQLHFFHSKALQGTRESLAAMEKWELLDLQASLVPQEDEGMIVQAGWGLLGHEAFPVIQEFQGQPVFLGDLILQENQESQDALGYLELLDRKDLQDQMASSVESGIPDHKERKAKWVLLEEQAPKEKKETRGSVPANRVPWAPPALQDFLVRQAVRETWRSLGGLERKAGRALRVLQDLQDLPENLVS